MFGKWSSSLAVIAIIFTLSVVSIEARRITIRPLSAKEVYDILRRAGREDAVPEGRIVTQGISAVTGFALGIAKGIGGSALYSLATSNATTEWINSLNLTASLPSMDLAAALPSINLTSFGNMDYSALLGNHSFTLPTLNLTSFTLPTLNFTALFGTKGGSGASSSGSSSTMVSQEICFKSRSIDSNGRQGRQSPTPTATTTGGTTTGTTGTTSPTYSSYSSPTSIATPTTATTGTGTIGDNGSNTVTNSGTTTSDAGDGAGTTCIVIEKPKSRHRRRRSILRKLHKQQLKVNFT